MRIARFVALLSLSVWSLASLNAQNLIANPGFESGLTSWAVTSGYYLNTAVYFPDSTIHHSGNLSVQGDETNDGSLGALQQNLTGKLVAGRTYILSGWIKTQNVADGGGAIIAVTYVDQHGAAQADSGGVAIGFVGGTQDWTYYQSAPFTLTPMPSDTVALVVSLDFSAAHGTAWWDDLKLIESCNVTQGPCITNPQDGASPQSQFVAISGTGTPNDTLSVLVGGAPVGTVTVDSEGNWEALPYVAPFGSSVTIQVQDQGTFNSSNTITVHPYVAPPPGIVGPAITYTRLLPLRKADIFVTADPSSAQVWFYGPTYTHTALYLGGDVDGTPWVAEAVTSTEAEANIFGQVRSVPLEHSLAWNGAVTMTAWHPRSPLPGATRSAIVTWAQNITIQGLPYGSIASMSSEVLAADALWAIESVTPVPVILTRFNGFLTLLNSAKNSTTSFVCSTLVWRAYWEGTAHTLDISTPNNITATPGSVLGNLPTPFRDAFIAQLASVFVVPQTFVTSPKLSQVF